MLIVFVQLYSILIHETSMEESWTKTRTIGDILTIKEREMNDKLQNT